MFGDPIKSITDNLVKKTTNPFFGTYIVVWCVRKWEIIYSIFNFDDKVLLETKVEHIKTIYGFKYTLVDVSVNMLWTIGALIATYVFLNLSRLITNFSEDIIKPIIEKQTSQFRIVSKDKYHSIESSNRQILKDFEKLKKDIREKESLISKIEEEKNNSKTELERLNSKFIETKAYSIYYRLQLSNEEENF